MAIRIASWNVECRLHGYQKRGRGTAAQILSEIAALDADVLVLPEFYMNSLSKSVERRLKQLGYMVFETSYDETDRDEDEREGWGTVHIGILSRLPMSQMEIIRPGGIRNLIACQVADPKSGKKIRVIATHLDDRWEFLRLKQVHELIPYINASNVPTVMLGDFNAMWHVGRARWLHAKPVYFISKLIPHKRLSSVVRRVAEMATGTVLAKLAKRTNLRDADPYYRPTTTPKMRDMPFMPSIRLIQIDHMLVSPELIVENFTIGKDGGSDHRSICAIIS